MFWTAEALLESFRMTGESVTWSMDNAHSTNCDDTGFVAATLYLLHVLGGFGVMMPMESGTMHGRASLRN